MKNSERISYLNIMCEDNLARMFSEDFIDQLHINWIEAPHVRAIATNMNYNTKHRYNVIFTETNDLSDLSFKTKAAYKEFRKELIERFEL